jgi:fatty-acid desaturase
MADVVLTRSVFWKAKLVIIVLHVLALGLAPFFFSWLGFAMFVVLWLITGLGVTVGYHRLLTHASFQTYQWVRWTLAIMGVLSGEGSPLFWVAFHRRHHDFADKPGDPHSPTLDGFWFAHMGWLWSYNVRKFPEFFTAYVPKLQREAFMRFLSSSYLGWHAALVVLLGSIGYLWGGWYGVLSLIVWGVLLRLVFVLNITWAVNSFSHRFGRRHYETPDDSRNNWVVALLSFGEGWHNNHHSSPTLAQHGHRWWEIDVSYRFIWLLEKLRLAWDVKKLKPSQ